MHTVRGSGWFRSVGVMLMALLAALSLLWLAPQARGESEDRGASAEKPKLSAEEAKKLDEAKAERARTAPVGPAEAQAQPERQVDKDAQGNPYVAGELIVTYEEKASAASEDGVKQKVGARVDKELAENDAEVLSFAAVKNERTEGARERGLERKKEELERDPNVEATDYNYVRKPLFTPNDPLAPQQWGLPKLRAYPSWDTARGTGATIAVIDSGIDESHPDISGVMDSWDFINNTPTVVDTEGHGTHVAGIAAALTSNGTGIAGASPDGLLFNYKVCDDLGCADEDIIAAINEAVRLDAEVINLSLGGYGSSTVAQNAVDNAWRNNVVVVASAGNDAVSTPNYPAAYPNAIAVSATNTSNGDSNFSNFGSWVDVAAPGGQLGAPNSQRILSTLPVALGSYGHKNGTSMAAPFVSGIAANLASRGLPATEIRRRLEATATDLGAPGKDVLFGRGLVNAHAAATNDTAPWVRYLNPVPNGTTYDRTPTIGATVADAQSALSRASIQLFVDGRKVTTFGYSGSRLSYTPSLAPGFHKVKIYVADPQGMSATAGWSFTVK